MPYAVDFENVSAVGLDSSPVAGALAGLRANEARYFMNKYKHEFKVVAAKESKQTLDYVSKILKEERDLAFASKALETSRFQVENIKFAYVFYEDGLAVNVMYTIKDLRSGPSDLSFRTGWKCQGSWRKNSSLPSRSPSWPERFAVRSL